METTKPLIKVSYINKHTLAAINILTGPLPVNNNNSQTVPLATVGF